MLLTINTALLLLAVISFILSLLKVGENNINFTVLGLLFFVLSFVSFITDFLPLRKFILLILSAICFVLILLKIPKGDWMSWGLLFFALSFFN